MTKVKISIEEFELAQAVEEYVKNRVTAYYGKEFADLDVNFFLVSGDYTAEVTAKVVDRQDG